LLVGGFMHFEDVLNDIEKQLIGKQLEPINSKTLPLYVIRIDRDAKKYYIGSDSGDTGKSRLLSELQDIWQDLTRKGFSNVDQSLYGSGSSRNQPETVFANLPYIQHFKYKRKKHILLRGKSVHEAGVLDEVRGLEFRRLRKQLDGYFKISVKNVAHSQEDLLNAMRTTFDSVLKKYPGESAVMKTESLLQKLESMQQVFNEGIVSLDFDTNNNELKLANETGQLDFLNTKEFTATDDEYSEDFIETSEFTGIDDPERRNNQDVSIEVLSENEKERSKKSTRIRQLTPVVSLIFDRIQYGDIELQPDFQRKDRIWSVEKKAKLIESILMRLPLPAFYFAEKLDGIWVVVDGLQRITTVYDFISGIFPLQKLDVLEDKNDLYFKDLTRQEQRDIREYAITAYLIEENEERSEEEPDMVVELFHRINTHGMKLSYQEIRSALNKGSSVRFLRYLVSLDIFKDSTHHKIRPDRQKDMELCLSALSFILFGYKNYNYKNYDLLLSHAMKKMNDHSLEVVGYDSLEEGNSYIESQYEYFKNLEKKYIQGLELAMSVFGEDAFIKDPSTGKKAISKPIYEIVVSYFSQLTEGQTLTLLNNSSSFLDLFYSAIEDNSMDYAHWDSNVHTEANRGFYYSLSTSTGKRATVLYRFSAFKEILKRSVGIDVEIQPIIEKNNDNN
jgi:hypothetical protein